MDDESVSISMVTPQGTIEQITIATQTSASEETPKKVRKLSSSSTSPTWAYGGLPSCPTCSKIFKNTTHLNQHMLVHSNERKYKCTYCEKTFKQMSHVQQHLRMHTGDKPYKCKVEGCEKGFSQMANLHHHMRTHDPEYQKTRKVSKLNQADWHQCDECDHQFSTTRGLACHKQKAHTKYNTSNSIVSASPNKGKQKKTSAESSEQPQQQHNEVSSSMPIVICKEEDGNTVLPKKGKITVSTSLFTKARVDEGVETFGMKLPTVAEIVPPPATTELPNIPASDVISALQ